MNFLAILLGIFFTVVSVLILSYVSIATILGPWIAPTIILFSTVISSLLLRIRQKSFSLQDLVKIQAIAAGGGIIATGVGFSLPIIFFLEPEVFDQWMKAPGYFCCMLGIVCFVGGLLGLCLGRLFSKSLIKKKGLPFPVSQLTFNVAAAEQQTGKIKALLAGISSTLFLLFLRDGIGRWKGCLPRYFSLFPSIFQDELSLSIRPMLWATGYCAGLETVLPLLVGLFSKYLILYPLNNHARFLPIALFQPYTPMQIAFAFCCGILLYEVFYAIPRYDKIFPKLRTFYETAKNKASLLANNFRKHRTGFKPRLSLISKVILYGEPIIALVSTFLLLSYFKFSLLAQIALILFSLVACYQVCFISGEVGLVQLGRFSTLVTLPMYILFRLSFVQITIVCVFFNVCAAVASDLLFDYKTGSLCGIEQTRMHRYQWLGLAISALSIGAVLWLLFSYHTIGSPELFAQRAQAKAAIILTFRFDKIVIFAGFLFAFILKKFKISPAMTFGGILMPNNMTFALLTGGFLNYFLRKSKNSAFFDFFSAGVFSSESLWVFINIFVKIFL
jgi:uncharacterized oligopeptide transporter (OPT) family protein